VKPGVSDQLDAWLVIIYDMVTKKHIHLPESSHLFLEIDQDLCTCNYYFVDHVLRTVFWLHTLDILGIGCPRSSHVYLRMSLITPFALTSELKARIQVIPWRKIIGFMSDFSPRPLLNMLRRP
jgi:hypothetical protein